MIKYIVEFRKKDREKWIFQSSFSSLDEAKQDFEYLKKEYFSISFRIVKETREILEVFDKKFQYFGVTKS